MTGTIKDSDPPEWHPLRSRTCLALGALFVLGLVGRLLFNLLAHPPGDFILSDMWVYDHRAANLLSGRLGPVDTFTPPGYPALLAAVYALFGQSRFIAMSVLQAAMGAALPLFTHAIGRRFVRDRRALWAATALTALYFPLVFYGGLLLTEIPFAFFLLLFLLLILRAAERRHLAWAGLAGATLGALCVIRPNGLLLLPVAAAYLWRALRHRQTARWAMTVLALVLGAAPIVGAAAAHNSRLLGRPTFLATNGGLNFLLAHAPFRGVTYTEPDTRFTHVIVPLYNLSYYEQMYDSPRPLYDERHYYGEAFAHIRQNPGQLLGDLNNVVEGLGAGRQGFWPGWAGFDRFLDGWSRGFFLLAILPAAVGVAHFARPRRASRERWLVFGTLATVVLGLYLFLGDPRLRVPFDPLILLLAAEAVAEAVTVAVRRYR